jgi:hypothetical protein
MLKDEQGISHSILLWVYLLPSTPSVTCGACNNENIQESRVVQHFAEGHRGKCMVNRSQAVEPLIKFAVRTPAAC